MFVDAIESSPRPDDLVGERKIEIADQQAIPAAANPLHSHPQ